MANRNIVAMTMLLLAILGASLQASETVTPVAGVERVRLRVAGIV